VGSTFIMFDVFSTSQHTASNYPSSWWMGVCKSSIEKMWQLALVLQPRDDPAALNHAYYVLELYNCASTGGQFHVAVPPAQRKRCLKQSTHHHAFQMMSSWVNLKEATCSREYNRVSACVLLMTTLWEAG